MTQGLTTHSGLINTSDGSPFSGEQLIWLLNGLNLFFQFVTVDYLSPTIVIGYDSKERLVWGQVGEFHGTPRRKLTWFENNWDAPNGELLEVLFRAFWLMWIDKGKELGEAVQRYVQSASSLRSGNPFSAIAESYAGLETLASVVLGKTDFESKKGIEEALCRADVPHRDLTKLDIPAFNELRQALDEESRKGVYLLNGVRNYVPHPLQGFKPFAEIKSPLYEVLQENNSAPVYLHDLANFISSI